MYSSIKNEKVSDLTYAINIVFSFEQHLAHLKLQQLRCLA